MKNKEIQEIIVSEEEWELLQELERRPPNPTPELIEAMKEIKPPVLFWEPIIEKVIKKYQSTHEYKWLTSASYRQTCKKHKKYKPL